MLLGYARGKVGDLVFSRRLGQQVTRAYNPSPKNPQSSKQMEQRTRLSGLVNAYRAMRVILDHSFTNRKEGATSYNEFVSANMAIAPYLSSEQAKRGTAIVLPYMVSKGVLRMVQISGAGDNAFTNIALGSLVIDDDTTIAAFSQAVIQNNADWQEGDQLSYLSVIQSVLPSETIYPHILAQEFKVTLDTNNEETLRTYMPDYATAVVDGFLGHGAHFTSGGFCWIHSRKDANGALQVSTQNLVCNIDNTTWQSQEQANYAMRSYGFADERYLVPGANDSSPANISMQVTDAYLAPGNGDYDSFALTDYNTSWLPTGFTAETPVTLTMNGSYLSRLSSEGLVITGMRWVGEKTETATSVAEISSVDAQQTSAKVVFTFPNYPAEVQTWGYSYLKVEFNGSVLFEWGVKPVVE